MVHYFLQIMMPWRDYEPRHWRLADMKHHFIMIFSPMIGDDFPCITIHINLASNRYVIYRDWMMTGSALDVIIHMFWWHRFKVLLEDKLVIL